MSESKRVYVYANELTPTQMRRAKALEIADVLFPSAGPDFRAKIAHWICLGRWDVRP